MSSQAITEENTSSKRIHVAVYWDFENIHISAKHLNDNHKDIRYTDEPPVMKVDALMDFIHSIGTVSINKAYADWLKFKKYRSFLMKHSIDLIQLFSTNNSSSKNGADMRMSLEILDDLLQHNHLTHFIVMAGDSDYISIAQKIKQKGKYIIGVGVKDTTNQYFVKACNEFHYYRSILAKFSTSDKLLKAIRQETKIAQSQKLLIDAMNAIMQYNEEDFAYRAALKKKMVQLDSTFNEANYGYSSFTKYLQAFSATIKINGERVLFI